jgi:F0F1-type ATP synthase beta subunit
MEKEIVTPSDTAVHDEAAPPARARTNRGAVRSVRGSVVDVRFDADLPPIHSVLRAGKDDAIVIEVLAQLDARHVRGIALTPTQGLARGAPVHDTGGPLTAVKTSKTSPGGPSIARPRT